MTLPEYFAALDFWNEAHGGESQGVEFTDQTEEAMRATVRKAVDKEDPEERKKFFAKIAGKKQQPKALGKNPKSKGKAPKRV